MIEFIGLQEAYGFELKEKFESEGPLIVLTGKNGIGKTRFLKGLSEGKVQAKIDGRVLLSNEVRYFSHNDVTPRMEGGFNEAMFEKQAKETAHYFAICKAEFVNEFDGMKVRVAGENLHEYQRLSYQDLHALCRRISARLNKPIVDLNEDDIVDNFELPMQGALGGAAVAKICNMYIFAKKNNQKKRLLSIDGAVGLKYVEREKEDEYFGVAPWVVLDEIMVNLFDGKFRLNKPVGGDPDFIPQLLDSNTGQVVSVDMLSSGERGLLFFALTLFNAHWEGKFRFWAPKLLVIDEPDVHLHPKMVFRMYLVLQEVIKKFGVSVVISTHSPTTVALAPEGSLYVLREGKVSACSKQTSVRELLDGVERVTVIGDTKRQVFVESQNDAQIYQWLFSSILNREGYDAAGIDLIFLPSGDGVPDNTVLKALKQVFDMEADEKSKEFVRVLNGGGCRSKVEWAVNRLVKAENFQVYGLIDWDNGNKSDDKICVLAEGEAYTIENLIYDPLCVMSYLNHEFGGVIDKFSNERVCGKNVDWHQWLSDSDLRQEVVDRFIKAVLGRENNRDVEMVYTSGAIVKTDSAYLKMDKDQLNKKVFEAYVELKRVVEKQGLYKNLGCLLVKKSMLSLARGEFIPLQFRSAFESLLAK